MRAFDSMQDAYGKLLGSKQAALAYFALNIVQFVVVAAFALAVAAVAAVALLLAGRSAIGIGDIFYRNGAIQWAALAPVLLAAAVAFVAIIVISLFFKIMCFRVGCLISKGEAGKLGPNTGTLSEMYSYARGTLSAFLAVSIALAAIFAVALLPAAAVAAAVIFLQPGMAVSALLVIVGTIYAVAVLALFCTFDKICVPLLFLGREKAGVMGLLGETFSIIRSNAVEVLAFMALNVLFVFALFVVNMLISLPFSFVPLGDAVSGVLNTLVGFVAGIFMEVWAFSFVYAVAGGAKGANASKAAKPKAK
jgi:hypothetical protein